MNEYTTGFDGHIGTIDATGPTVETSANGTVTINVDTSATDRAINKASDAIAFNTVIAVTVVLSIACAVITAFRAKAAKKQYCPNTATTKQD